MADVADIPGVLLERPRVHADSRGHFCEIYRQAAMPEAFAQSNHSFTAAGALRGLHYHTRQSDLWYVVRGRAQVALADLRGGSGQPTVATLALDAAEPAVLYIPSGVAHGYLALSNLDLIYWVTSEYDPADEHGIAWDDPGLAVPWQLDGVPILSERDRANPALRWSAIPAFS